MVSPADRVLDGVDQRQGALPGKYETEPGNALDALVGATHEEVDADLIEISTPWRLNTSVKTTAGA